MWQVWYVLQANIHTCIQEEQSSVVQKFSHHKLCHWWSGQMHSRKCCTCCCHKCIHCPEDGSGTLARQLFVRIKLDSWQALAYEAQICQTDDVLTWICLFVSRTCPYCRVEVLKKLLCCVGNLVELVIPRPSPTGEEGPGVGKVRHLCLHPLFVISECGYYKEQIQCVVCAWVQCTHWPDDITKG